MTCFASGCGATNLPSMIARSSGFSSPGSRAPVRSRSSTVASLRKWRGAVDWRRQPPRHTQRRSWMAVSEEIGRDVPIREGHYGDRVAAIEPGGIEYIADDERHGRPLDLFWTWMSPNLEFATIFVGVIPVALLGGSFWTGVAAVVVGTALGSLTHAVLSSWGPKFGVPQLVESRSAFGYWGNLLPAGLQSVTASIGWFIVNSVSGAFALQTLFALIKLPALPFGLAFAVIVVAQVAVAFLGSNSPERLAA